MLDSSPGITIKDLRVRGNLLCRLRILVVQQKRVVNLSGCKLIRKLVHHVKVAAFLEGGNSKIFILRKIPATLFLPS